MLVQFSFLILSLLKDSIIRRVAVVVACLFFFVDALINDASRRGAERLSRCRAAFGILVFFVLVALLNVTTTLSSFQKNICCIFW
jgi:hypothetical protein